MISPRLTNCKECANIPDLLRKIDCKLAELGNNLYNNVVFMLNRSIAVSEISELLVYKRILQHRFCDTHYAKDCNSVSTEDIASKVIRLTAGCVPFCNEPTVCEITTCAVKPCPNPTTTTTSTSSTSTTSTTSTSSTTTSTTTINCNFTGVIDCSITTTTTTSSSTSTTTSTVYPGVAPCTWSTYGGNPGEIAVYDFNTNSSTAVLVPNDFTTTVGINRPICSTGDKLWLASVTTNDTVAYIREWDINTSGAVPTLSYVREITIEISSLQYKSIWGTTISTIAATSDNNTLLVGFGDKVSGGQTMGVYEWDISTAGDITLNEGNDIAKDGVSFGNTYGILTELTGMFITNSDNVILSSRYYENESASNASNRIKQYPGLPSSGSWSSPNSPVINLQNAGVPEFTSTWTGSTKAMPAWGVNGLLQVIQPETLEVYNISQTAPYNATLETTVADDSVWIHTSTGCANVSIELTDPDCDATWIPALTERNANNDIVYTGPVTFTYEGIQVTASADDNVQALIPGDPVGGIPLGGCSGLSNPAATNKLAIVQGNDFSITLTFESPINNLPIRAAIFNTSPDFSSGDVYEINTNAGTPSISISSGCNVQVQGNRIGGGVPDYNTEGDGEFIVTTPTNFTSITISGNAPTGGPILLGCVTPPLDCSRIFTGDIENCSDGICAPENLNGSYNRVYSQNTITNTIEEIVLPGGSYFQTPNSDIANNYFIGQVNNRDEEGNPIRQFTRWNYDTTLPSGTPSNFTWEGILYTIDQSELPNIFPPTFYGLSTINDNLIVLLYGISSFAGGGKQVIEAEFVEGSTTLAVAPKFFIPAPFNGSGEHVVTLKEDGTPNKFISLRTNGYDGPIEISQFDYDTGNLEVDIPGPPVGSWISGGDMAVVDDYLYISLRSTISGVGETLWRVNLQTHVWEEVSDEAAYMGGSSGSLPLCRTNDGFAIIGTTTTTTTNPDISTTTTTTTPIPGVRTIFTKFSAGSEPA